METRTKGDVSTCGSPRISVSRRSHASTNGLDDKRNDVLQLRSGPILKQSLLDGHTQVQNTMVSEGRFSRP